MLKKITKVNKNTTPDTNREQTEVAKVSSSPKKRVCYFCESKNQPTFTDSAVLRRYMSDRARIIPKIRTGVCSKHQRQITRHIKYARHLSLLPFVPKV